MFWKYDDEKEEVVARQPSPERVAQQKKNVQELLAKVERRDEDFLSSDEVGSADRFEKRVEGFKKEDKPVYKHHAWWLVHNCVAHFLIGVLPCKATFDFHDWTSKKINGK